MKKAGFILLLLLLVDLGVLAYLHYQYPKAILIPKHPAISAGFAEAPARRADRLSPQALEHLANTSHITMHFLDIGQGDATYIEFPDGEDMLVDCAKDARILTALGRVMKWRDNTIDYLVITHPHADHYGGCMDVLKRFTIKHILYSGYRKETDPVWRYFWDTVREKEKAGSEYDEITREQTFSIGSSTVHILYPDHNVNEESMAEEKGEGHAVNDTSIVFLLRYGKNQALFTGDMETLLEKKLIAKYGRLLASDVLKAGHHGSPGSTSQPFIDAVRPKYATISVGKYNKYGHPSHRILKRLERAHAQIWRTDEVGDITVSIDGEQVLAGN